MSCYHPFILINTSNMLDPVQREICEKLKASNALRHGARKYKSVNTIFVPRELAEKEGLTLKDNNAIVVPCCRCVGCRLDYSRIWAERCFHEAQQYEHNYFLTLTYDDVHLPKSETTGVPTLKNDEISKFMKALRQYFKTKFDFDGIRFLACAEYGHDQRPHYHLILFNCPLPDLQERHPVPVDGKIKMQKLYSDGEDGQRVQLLYSPIIGKIWNKGLCPIGEVTFQSCAYVSRYIMKKQYGDDAKVYADCGILPPFLRMSLKPGIGYKWYQDNYDKILEDGYILLNRGDKVVRMSPSKYFYKLVLADDPDLYYKIKHNKAEDIYRDIGAKDQCGVDYVRNSHIAESQKKTSVKLLKRNV